MVYYIWILTLVIKLTLSAWYPLFQDEMYYWMWAQNPSLSYFDHPPFIAWLMRAGLPLDQMGSAVRWPTVIFGHLALLIWIHLLRDRLDSKALVWFVLLFSMAPLTGLGSIIATPDVPLLVFWSLSILALVEALRTQTISWYMMLGLSAGLGFCSKYHMALFLPLVLIYFVMSRQKLSAYLKLLLAVGLAAAAAFPVFFWNYMNDWASFRFQLQRGLGQWGDFKWFAEYIGGQLSLLIPGVLLAAIVGAKKKENLLFAVLGWGPLIFFLASSLKGRVEPNWTTVAYPSLFFLAVSAGDQWTKWIKSTVFIWFVAFLLLVSHLAHRWLPIDDRALKLNEFTAFDEYLPIFKEYPNTYASSYQMAATMSFKLRKPIYKLRGINRKDHYDLMPQSLPEQTPFYLLQSAWNDHPDWLKANYTTFNVPVSLPEYVYLNGFKEKELKP